MSEGEINKNKIESLLSEIDENLGLTLLFNKLSEVDSLYPLLFFVHRNQLFPTEEFVVMPYLFWNNLYHLLEDEEDDIENIVENSILKITTELQMIKEEQIINTGFKFLFESPEDLRELLFYYLIKFLRQNEELKKLIEEREFSFNKMQRTLKDYNCISLNIFKELEDLEDTPDDDFSEGEKVVRAKIRSVISRIKVSIGKDPLKFQDIIISQINQLFVPHFFGIENLQLLLDSNEIHPEEYAKFISELYTLKLIYNIHTIFWCENCRDEPQILQTTSKLDPYHSEIICPKCGMSMCCSTIFKLDNTLLKTISSNDGILGVYLGWLLKKKSIKYNCFTYETNGRFENDYIIEKGDKKILIECKMHRTDKDEDSIRNALIQDINQIIKHIEDIGSIKKAFILCNYDLKMYQDILGKVYSHKKYKIKIKKYGMKIIDYSEVGKLIEELTK